MFIEKLILVVSTYVIYSIIHDVVIKKIYCAIKMKKGNRKKCYYWNCKKWHNCPYNEG